MKREYIIASIGIILIVLNLYLIANPDFSTILGATTSTTTGATVSIISRAVEVNITSSGNATFDDTPTSSRINVITGLTQGWSLNLTLYGNRYPSLFTERQPNSTESGPTRIEYFEIAINATTTGGSYNIFFNATQSQINISASNISLFIYESSSDQWLNVSTTIINSTSNPAQFFSTVTHFSKFFIGEKPPTTPSGGGGSGPEPSGPAGGGGGSSGRATVTAPPPITGEAFLDLLVKKNIPIKPIRIPGNLFDVWAVIPEKYQTLFRGDKLVAEINLVNIKKRGATAVMVEYSINDIKETQLFRSFETKVVENEIAYIKEIILPPDIDTGVYLFKVTVLYDDDIAIAGFPFEVIERPPVLWIPYSLWRGVALIIITIIGIVFALRYLKKIWNKKMLRENKQETVINKKNIPHEDIIEQQQWSRKKYPKWFLLHKQRLLQAKKELREK